MRTDSILPFPAPPSRESAMAAIAASAASTELASSLRSDLAWAAVQEEEPGFELLERYVNGELDPEAAEALESRAAADPALAREIDDLVALRVKLHPATAPAVVRTRPRLARLSLLAAALLVVALGLDWSLEHRAADSRASWADSSIAGGDRASAPATLYADGFESGDVSAWTN
jgi:anti-sigma factor RsiW